MVVTGNISSQFNSSNKDELSQQYQSLQELFKFGIVSNMPINAYKL